MRLIATILFASAALCQAAESAAGRWEGAAQIPGHELKLVVDLSDEGGEGWILTADRKFNEPMFFTSNWREAPIVATEREFNIGAIFSTPLVMNGAVYFGSTDGNLYAID